MRRPHSTSALLPMLLMLVCAPAPVAAQAAAADSGAAPPRVGLSDLVWSADGSTFAGFVTDAGVRVAVAAFDGETGRPTWRLELSALRESAVAPWLAIDSLWLSVRRGEALVVADGDLFWISASGPSARRLTQTAAAEEQVSLAPDGTHAAFVRQGDLYVIEVANGREQRLTQDGAPPLRINAALPTLDLFASGLGYAWAPESRTLAYLRRAGELEQIALVELVGGVPRTIDLGFGSGRPTGVEWRFDARALAIESRLASEREETIHLCSTERLRCLPLARRTVAPDAEPRRDFLFLADGFLWGAASGGATLSRWDTVGRERQPLLTGNPRLERIEAGEEEAGWVVARVSRPGSIGGAEAASTLLALPLAIGTPTPLDPGPGGAVESVAPSGSAWIALATDAAGKLHRTLRVIDGRIVAELPAP